MKFHNVQNIDFEGPDMVLTVDDRVHRVDLAKISQRLAQADMEARRSYSVSPSGYGIHWPAVDEDLTVDGLIAAAAGAYPKKHEGRQSTMMLNDKPIS
jgi:hypothetical protein